jgi:hypothetical protein
MEAYYFLLDNSFCSNKLFHSNERRPKMPDIITTSLYPSDKAPEVAKRYMDAITKYPPDANLGTLVVPAAVKTTLDGVRTIGIIEVKKGKFEDAMTRVMAMMSMFMSIQGFEYTIESYATVEEAMKVIGM